MAGNIIFGGQNWRIVFWGGDGFVDRGKANVKWLKIVYYKCGGGHCVENKCQAVRWIGRLTLCSLFNMVCICLPVKICYSFFYING